MKKILLLILLSAPLFADNLNDAPKDVLPFTQYKPTYLLFGDKKDQVKTQISFKYQLFQPYNLGLYLGFTQQMFWNVYDTGDSSPMKELNYNPEIFWKKDINAATFRYIQITTFEHKSNGRPSGSADRTWDRSGITIANKFDLNYFEIGTYIRAYYAYNLGSQNENIRDYIGYTEARISVRSRLLKNSYTDSEELSVRFIGGFNGLGAREYSLKLRTLLPHFAPNFYFQVWEGYGENLLDYNVYSQAYRVGLIFE